MKNITISESLIKKLENPKERKKLIKILEELNEIVEFLVEIDKANKIAHKHEYKNQKNLAIKSQNKNKRK